VVGVANPEEPELPAASSSAQRRDPVVAPEQVEFLIRDLLRSVHGEGARTAIVGADGVTGAFPDAGGLSVRVRPLVIDANWLRGDVLHACQNGRQTVMLTASNQNIVRLYCAPHVVNEVEEHHAEWTNGKKVSATEFRRCWEQQYLPLLRVVVPPDGLLREAEALRIDALRLLDPDDVPSASLALILEAPLISADGRAVRAVYGPEHVVRKHTELLGLLRDASDVGQLAQLATVAAFVPAAPVYCLVRLLGLTARTSPMLLLPLGAATLWAGSRVPPSTRRRIGEVAGRMAQMTGHAAAFYWDLRTRIEAATPAQPSWPELASERSAGAALARACMRTLARNPGSQMSAAELTASLPDLGVAQHEKAVRGVLRTLQGVTFEEVHRGRWQLGHCAAPAVVEGTVVILDEP
jgi:predicted nucleic acid-binding protein